MKIRVILLTLLLLFLVFQPASATVSTNYRLDWFTPLNTAGGGPVSSAHYSADITIGQTAYTASTSSAYQASLGYWAGILSTLRVMLPLMMRP